MKRLLEGVMLAAALVVAGCSHGAATPADALRGYAAAVERKDHRAAYGFMSDAYRKRVPLHEFERRMRADAVELAADAASVRRNADRFGTRVEVSIEGDKVTLIKGAKGWRLDALPIDPYRQDSPRAALRAFVRAVESRRYDVLLRLAPSRRRSALSIEKLRGFWEGELAEQNRTLVRELRLHLDARIVEEGDEAFMTYGVDRQIRLLREAGAWTVENPS